MKVPNPDHTDTPATYIRSLNGPITVLPPDTLLTYDISVSDRESVPGFGDIAVDTALPSVTPQYVDVIRTGDPLLGITYAAPVLLYGTDELPPPPPDLPRPARMPRPEAGLRPLHAVPLLPLARKKRPRTGRRVPPRLTAKRPRAGTVLSAVTIHAPRLTRSHITK